MNTFFITTVALAFILICGIIVILGTLSKYPSIVPMVFAKNLVWEIQSNGNLQAKKAKILYGAMKTKKGIYFYERLDVVNCHGKSSIIVNESDAKAIRAPLQPVFTLLKKLNVPNRESLYTLLNAPTMTMEQYKKLQKGNGNKVVQNE